MSSKMFAAFVLVASAGLAQASVPGGGDERCALMVVDSELDRVVLLDDQNGSLLHANWIDIGAAAASAGYTGGLTPIEAISVGNEIWISDQVADRIWRFDTATRTYAGFIGGAGDLNNIRGMHRFGDTVYVAMGEASDNYGAGIVTIDANTGAITGEFNGRNPSETSYWDVNFYGGNLIVSNSSSDGLEIYSIDGSYLGQFVTSDGVTGIDFPQQIARTEDGELLVAGFSSPSGVYMFNEDGVDLGIVAAADFGPRGVFELGNGEILWTNGTFIRTDGTVVLDDGSFRFITKICGVVVPAPAGAMTLGLAGLLVARRRR